MMRALVIAGIALVFLLDRWIKYAALSHSWEGVLITRTFGGIALPMFVGIAVAIVVSATLLFWSMRRLPRERIAVLAILSGAASNLFDRLMFGGVVDWFVIGEVFAFNGADALIAAGALALLFFFIRI